MKKKYYRKVSERNAKKKVTKERGGKGSSPTKSGGRVANRGGKKATSDQSGVKSGNCRGGKRAIGTAEYRERVTAKELNGEAEQLSETSQCLGEKRKKGLVQIWRKITCAKLKGRSEDDASGGACYGVRARDQKRAPRVKSETRQPHETGLRILERWRKPRHEVEDHIVPRLQARRVRESGYVEAASNFMENRKPRVTGRDHRQLKRGEETGDQGRSFSGSGT